MGSWWLTEGYNGYVMLRPVYSIDFGRVAVVLAGRKGMDNALGMDRGNYCTFVSFRNLLYFHMITRSNTAC